MPNIPKREKTALWESRQLSASEKTAASLLQDLQFPFTDVHSGTLWEWQRPDSDGFYCPGIYFAFGDDLVKIGCTGSPNQRFRCLRTPSGTKPAVIIFVPECLLDSDFKISEKELHNRFASHRVLGEWFQISDEIAMLAAGYLDTSELVLKLYRLWFARIVRRWINSKTRRRIRDDSY